MSVRVRYAPSPTGLQHIGGVRTALFNYFFAKAQGGQFFLRIEDTDQGRLDPRAIDDIYATFDWLGIRLDEGPREGGTYGPYVQSERLAIYQSHAQALIESGHAYYCFCTSQELEARRAERSSQGLPSGYDRLCRGLSPAAVAANLAAKKPAVIRFAIPEGGETIVNDCLLGQVAWPNKDINPDPVLLKADGFPTYHLAHPVDDHLMATTHVLRGQEWLPSAPLHVLLFQAFGWAPPIYCHLSTIMGADGHKLSKRHGSTSAQEFRTGGYLAEAVINYISLLGWSYDDKTEFLTTTDLERLFSLEKLSKSPAIFDYQKLDWFNGQWIRRLDDSRLADLAWPWLVQAGLVDETADRQRLIAAIPLARDRLVKISDVVNVLDFVFRAPDTSDPSRFIPKKQDAAAVRTVLSRLLPELAGFDQRNDEANEAHLHQLATDWNLPLGQILMPLRLAITGTAASPPLVTSMRILGLTEAIDRVKNIIQVLS